MRVRRILALVLAASAASVARVPAGAEDPAKPHIDDLRVRREGNRVAVSFRLVAGLSDELLERVQSGIPLTFRHEVDLLRRRVVPLWPPKLVASARVETTVRYDSLTRQYDLLRKSEIVRPREGTEEQQRSTTDSIEDVRRFMTELDEIPSIELPTDPPPGRLRVRVESSLGRRYVLFLIPTRQSVSAESRLEP